MDLQKGSQEETQQDQKPPQVKPAEEEPQKEPPKVEQTEIKPTPQTPPKTEPQPKKSNTGIIVAIVIVVLLLLGVGGYFGVRYVLKKYINKSTSTTGKVSVQTVIDALMYPGAKITDQKVGEQDSAYKAELTLASDDNVKTISDYYIKLAGTKKWTTSRQGSSSDNNYYLTVTDGVFTAEIDITKYDGYDTTDIGIRISGDHSRKGLRVCKHRHRRPRERGCRRI